MELRQLNYLLAVAEERHFGRAARRLHISQPGLSQQIRQLEATLGVQLVQRTTHPVTLTHAGRILLEQARPALAQLEIAMRNAQRAGRGELGQTLLGFVEPTVYTMLPAVVQQFQTRYSDAALILEECTPIEQVTGIREGTIDVGLVYLPLAVEPELQIEVIMREPIVVALPADHPLGAHETLALRDLNGEALVTTTRHANPLLYDHVLQSYREAGFSPRIVQAVTSKQAMIGLVAARIGIALMPYSLQGLRRDGVTYRRVRDESQYQETAVIWRQKEATPVVLALLTIIREVGRAYQGAIP